MERIVPWSRLIAVIEPLYPKSGRVGRPPIGVAKMLRMYCLQQWYGLADEALEDALYDSQALRDFVGIDLSRESVPDTTTLLKFRRLLEDHDLTAKLFEGINADLTERGLLLREGTMVDATIIAAPPSTKNKDKVRDPEMHETKKGQRVALRHEGAYRCRRRFGPGAQPSRHVCQRQRCGAHARSAARAGDEGLPGRRL
jgi:transposase, IS5 family